MGNTRKYWGWGYENVPIPVKQLEQYKQYLQVALQIETFEDIDPIPIDQLTLPKTRFDLPSALSMLCTDATFDRASHSYGNAFRDVWRSLHGQFENAVDYVAYPKSPKDIEHLFDFATHNRVALIPYGGGSSVCGGVEPTDSGSYTGGISVDMKHFNQLLEVDPTSRSAHIQAGIYGPDLESKLRLHGFTLRHYPQSFEFSTLGGWIATRAGGHYATLYTHIDEFVESINMLTPNGWLQTRRLPGSGAGPSEERFLTGSEGIFGIITSAWMRVQDIPSYKQAQTVFFPTFGAGVDACRALAQSGLYPSNARLIDPIESYVNGLGDGKSAVLLLGFESHQHTVNHWIQEALSICKSHSGSWINIASEDKTYDNTADTWKQSFFHAPYLRDEGIRLGLIVETFESAVTWDKLPEFDKQVKKTAHDAIQQYCGGGLVTCRLTHLYPDGCAPYYTLFARGAKGRQLEQWDKIKEAVSQCIIDYGGTITHHHAVGRIHQPYYQQQRSTLFGQMLSESKRSVDPHWIMNPGILISEPKEHG